MKQVKGSMLKTTIKAIKANKSGVYDNLLSDNVREILKNRILDSIWYPFDLYKESLNALSKVEGNNNPKILNEWGHEYCAILMKSIYQSTLVKGDIKKSMEKYARFHNLLYNFGKVIPEFPSDYQLLITFKDFESDFKNWYYIAFGWLEKFIELCLGKKISHEIKKKSWDNEDSTQTLFSWSS